MHIVLYLIIDLYPYVLMSLGTSASYVLSVSNEDCLVGYDNVDR